MVCVRNFSMIAMMCLMLVMVPTDGWAQDSYAEREAKLAREEAKRAHEADMRGILKEHKANIEKKIKDIANGPAKPGESLKDEIQRKKKETSDLRERLKEAEDNIVDYEKRLVDEAKAKAQKKQADKQIKKDRAALKKFKKTRDARRKALKGAHTFTTKCKPCEGLTKQLTSLDGDRYRLEWALIDAEYEYHWQKADIEAQVEKARRQVDKHKKAGSSGPKFGLGTAGLIIGRGLEIEDDYKKISEKLKKQLEATKKSMAQLLAQLVECEKQCKNPPDRSNIIGSLPGGGKTTAMPALPFKWEGPYTTKCPPCVKLAAKLNTLPPMVRERQVKLMALRSRIARLKLEEELAEYEDNDDYGYGYAIKKAEAEIKKIENQIRNIKEYFHKVLKMLRDCEEKHCNKKIGCVLPGENQLFVPSGGLGTGEASDETALCSVEVELDYTVSVFGTNGFDAYEIERIPDMVNGSDNTTGTTTPTTPTTTDSTTPTTTDPTTPTTPTTPVTPTTPLAVTASGVVTFAHTVSSSPCPQDAGTIMISSNNGNPLTVSGVSTSGTLMNLLTNTVNGSGSANPSITAQFNCSSATNGSFSGNVAGTVTDTVTGETSNFSVPASGTVTGP